MTHHRNKDNFIKKEKEMENGYHEDLIQVYIADCAGVTADILYSFCFSVDIFFIALNVENASLGSLILSLKSPTLLE